MNEQGRGSEGGREETRKSRRWNILTFSFCSGLLTWWFISVLDELPDL